MLDIVSFIAIPFQALSIFYKPLSDRFGRKIFLVINTLGMSLGMLVIALSHNLALYVVGAVIIFFFVPHDMQVVYVMESAPSKHRAKIYSRAEALKIMRYFYRFSCKIDQGNAIQLSVVLFLSAGNRCSNGCAAAG